MLEISLVKQIGPSVHGMDVDIATLVAAASATRRITGSLIGTMGIVTLLPFVQLDGLWKCIYDTFPGPGLSREERRNSAAYMHIDQILFIFVD